MNYPARWLRFVKERFSPTVYGPMMFVFLAAHIGLENFGKHWLIILAITFFFFKLRLFDEIKDYRTDKVLHSERPLPRGLLQVKDLKIAALLIVIIELLIFAHYGEKTFLMGSISIFYSFLMYREFFIGKWLGKHLMTYAITHTIIASLMSLTIYAAYFNLSPMELPLQYLKISLSGWLIFNVFEFGRKTYASEEEKKGIHSYSKILGRFGAVFLVFTQVIPATILLRIDEQYYGFLILAIAGILYIIKNETLYSSIYRAICSLYILFFYLTITFNNLPN